MEIGAVIVAAGMSSRMGDFKPMLSIGEISVAQRVVATLRQAGAERVVVVTGYNADELERHLARSGAVFVRNENYRTTEMFDSALIGLKYMSGKCGRILFTPVDVPLFTAATVRRLLDSGAEFTAIFAISDMMAIAAIKALEDRGRRVPESCSVIAIDGLELSEYTRPTLTTLCQPSERMGAESVRILMEMIEGRGGNRQILLEPELRPGGSVRAV